MIDFRLWLYVDNHVAIATYLLMSLCMSISYSDDSHSSDYISTDAYTIIWLICMVIILCTRSFRTAIMCVGLHVYTHMHLYVHIAVCVAIAIHNTMHTYAYIHAYVHLCIYSKV